MPTPAFIYRDMDLTNNGYIDADEFIGWWYLQKYKVPRTIATDHFLNELALHIEIESFSRSDLLIPEGKYGQVLIILLAGTVSLMASQVGAP